MYHYLVSRNSCSVRIPFPQLYALIFLLRQFANEGLARMPSSVCGYLFSFIGYLILYAGGIALVIISLIALSTSAFLLVRYQHGDQPPHPALPSTCWYLAAASLVTVLLCAVAPFFKILRKIRWTFWIVSFGLWVNAAVITHRIPGWGTDSEGRYCKMVQVQHCKHIEVLLNPILSISMILAIVWDALQVFHFTDSYNKKPFGCDEIFRRRYRVRRMDARTIREEAQVIPLPQFAPVPAPEVDVGPPEHQQSPVGAGSVPGPPDPAHVRASTLGE
ncbi:hypothetical protein BKA70DRAFT_1300649 [Coprinopsis sp. MPI-PUGE-AT-0042]|nr:hypothetical protein BKA70DRAFT_1300649 [Coprinopsis sp. MPI-PUGE-AT-0042]